MHVGVIGAGVFGRQLGRIFERSGAQISYASRSEPLAGAATFDVVCLSVPVQELRIAVTDHRSVLSDALIVQCGKGMERRTGLLPHEIVNATLGKSMGPYAALVGPSFAKDMAREKHTAFTVGSHDADAHRVLSTLVAGSEIVLEHSKDVIGLELAAAMKNVYAILFGFIDGIGLGENARAAFFVRALKEYALLARELGSHEEILTYGVLGDFFLSASSPTSRNYAFGAALASAAPEDIFRLLAGKTVEGYYTAQALQLRNHPLPLVDAVRTITTLGAAGRPVIKKLFAARP